MRYPILRQKAVADALWAYRNAVMAEASADVREKAFLNETGPPAVTQEEWESAWEELETESAQAIAAVKAAYDALEAALQAAKPVHQMTDDD